jgi:hypothetical protein
MMSERAVAEENGHPFVRIAELEVDAAHLERFKTAATEQIATAVRVEPGVLALYAVSVMMPTRRHIGLTWKRRISSASGRRPTTS